MTSCTETNDAYTITLVEGATFKLSLNVSGIDLTGASADMIISSGYPDFQEYFFLESPSGISITVTTPVTEQLLIVTIPHDDVINFSPSKGEYDLFDTLASGERKRILKGLAIFESSLPRP